MNYRDEFEKIVENIKVNRNALPEEFNQKMQPMIQFIQNNIPNQLYKFRSCTEYSLDAFEKDEIWLANASLFNDLHDSLLFLDKPTILEHAKKVFAPENATTLFKYIKQYQEPLEKLKFADSNMRTFIRNGLDALDERTFLEKVQQILPGLDAFLETSFSAIREEIRGHIKMACLSESIKSPLMWAHYADNHKGFAIGYDFRDNNISQCSNCSKRLCGNIKLATIYPIIYSDKRFDATSYGQWRVEQYMKECIGILPEGSYEDEFLFTKAALHKSNDWKYENEWRIICSTPNQAIEQKNRYPIIKPPIAIYLGCQIPDIYRKLLIYIADMKGIAKYQMIVKDYSHAYELDYKPL